MGAIMITNRSFFFDHQFRPKITDLAKAPEFRKMAIVISLSELILAFFF